MPIGTRSSRSVARAQLATENQNGADSDDEDRANGTCNSNGTEYTPAEKAMAQEARI